MTYYIESEKDTINGGEGPMEIPHVGRLLDAMNIGWCSADLPNGICLVWRVDGLPLPDEIVNG